MYTVLIGVPNLYIGRRIVHMTPGRPLVTRKLQLLQARSLPEQPDISRTTYLASDVIQ